VTGSGLFENKAWEGTEHLGWIFNFVNFEIGALHYDEILIRLGGMCLGRMFEVNI
jgi:hypothetical protein